MRLAATSLKGLVAANLFLTNLKCVCPGIPGNFNGLCSLTVYCKGIALNFFKLFKISITFVTSIATYIFMEHQNSQLIEDELDIRTSKTSTSRFFFLLGFFGIFVFAWAGCYSLYTHSY